MTPSEITSVRAAATQCLFEVIHQHQSLNKALAKALERIDAKDQALLKEMCYGSIRWYFKLNLFLKKLLQKPLKTKDHDLACLMILGLYQLQFMRTSPHAVVDETVKTTQKLKKDWAKNLVNAILRRFLKDREQLDIKLRGQLQYRFSHPEWFIEKVRASWPEQWKDILDENNALGPMTLRVNTQRCQLEDYVTSLRNNNIYCQPIKLSSEGLQLETPSHVEDLPGFSEGACSVQDEAAQLAAHLLKVESKQRVLDACCAPGGKLCHIRELTPDVSLIGLDAEENRLQQTAENLNRLKFQDVNLICAPAEDLQQWWDGQYFDRILLDAPCSGTGVIRRHPDIKVLRNSEDIAKLASLQHHLLVRLWQTLKIEGLLVFATCSILPDENEQVIRRFLTEQKDAEHLAISDIEAGQQREFGRQFFPQRQGHDGFYYACLKKMPA